MHFVSGAGKPIVPGHCTVTCRAKVAGIGLDVTFGVEGTRRTLLSVVACQKNVRGAPRFGQHQIVGVM